MTRTPADELYAATSFGEFWDHYQAVHRDPHVRALHAVATASALGLLALAWARRSLGLALLAPLVDFAIAQASHRQIDGRRTAPYRRPLWHARAEWRLFRQSLRDAERRFHDHL